MMLLLYLQLQCFDSVASYPRGLLREFLNVNIDPNALLHHLAIQRQYFVAYRPALPDRRNYPPRSINSFLRRRWGHQSA